MSDRNSETLSDSELEALTLALRRGQGTFTKASLRKVFAWAHETKIAGATLRLVLAGEVVIVAVNEQGEPVFLPAVKAN